MRAWWMAGWLVGCGPIDEPGADAPLELPPPTAAAVLDVGGTGFFDTPWPSDARRTPAGGPDWSAFPNPAELGFVDQVITRASEATGHATSAPLYLRFDRPIDVSVLPTGADSQRADAPIQLIDITPASPTFGERTPLVYDAWAERGAYVTSGLVAVATVPGWPLRPRTTYALVVLDTVSLPVDGWQATPVGGSPWGEVRALVEAAAPTVGLDPARIAVASTFTTGEPTALVAEVARFLRERVDPPVFTAQLEPVEEVGSYVVHRSTYTTPVFMEGAKPYGVSGGRFVLRDDGLPQVRAWDLMRLSVVVPEPLGAAPPSGWPVLVYLHGTGGDYRTFCNSDSALEVGKWATELGAVGLGIDLPLHGPRGTPDTNLELHSFNVLQPDSALHIHRQAAADLIYLLSGLSRGVTFRTPSGAELPIDPSRIVVMGHSQGGLTAAIALPWIGDLVSGVMLSGTGGLLAITAVERDSDFNIPQLIRDTLQLDEDEVLTEMHPVIGLVQSIVDPTDPINYAPYWFHEDGGFGGVPTPVLLTTGLGDLQTPTRTSEALAAAARMPFAGKRRTAAPGSVLRGFDDGSFPLRDNVAGFDGLPVTAGISQWPDGDHFVVFTDTVARDIVRNFVVTSWNGAPEIVKGDPPAVR